MSNGKPQGGGVYYWNFCNKQNDDVEAKYNYWVAVDNETIDRCIYDNEEGGGEVEFYPFATGPVPCAPIPELATFILFGTGLIAIAGYVGLGRRRRQEENPKRK
jgi:hypothetical protein